MDQEELTKALQQFQENNKAPEKNKKYYLFGDGKYKNEGYLRCKPTYRKQVEIDKIRIKAVGLPKDIKDKIKERHKFSEQEIEEKYNELDFLTEIINLVGNDIPKDYDPYDIDTGESERMFNDFLRDCRA